MAEGTSYTHQRPTEGPTSAFAKASADRRSFSGGGQVGPPPASLKTGRSIQTVQSRNALLPDALEAKVPHAAAVDGEARDDPPRIAGELNQIDERPVEGLREDRLKRDIGATRDADEQP